MMTDWACLKICAVSTVPGAAWSPSSPGVCLFRGRASIMSVVIAFKSVDHCENLENLLIQGI